MQPHRDQDGKTLKLYNVGLKMFFSLFPFLGDYDINGILLILDRYRAHLSEEFCYPIVTAGILLENIPARCTSLVQPLDLTIMRGFKTLLRKYWKQWKTEVTENDGTSPRIQLQNVLGLISRAWADVAPVVSSCGPNPTT